MKQAIQNLLLANTTRIKGWMDAVGYDHRHWTRPVMYERCAELIRGLNPGQVDALEISAGNYFQTLGFRSFTEANYPEFDICQGTLDRQFDLVIADQVFEHLLWPYRAIKNVHAMVKPGGHFLVTTPFLIRIHAIPYDCTRWTETGIKYFLMEAGFEESDIVTGSWGNRACVKANFGSWARRGWFGSLKNEPDYPVVVWAMARKRAAAN